MASFIPIVCFADIENYLIKFLIIKGFVKHFRIKMSNMKSEQRFDDSKSSLSSSKHMVKLIIYIVTKV